MSLFKRSRVSFGLRTLTVVYALVGTVVGVGTPKAIQFWEARKAARQAVDLKIYAL